MIAAFITDIHLREDPPRNRLEKDFLQVILDKIEWTIDYCNKEGIEILLLGGDMGDHWRWSTPMVHRTVEVLEKFNGLIVSTVGNHDVPGGNPTLFNNSGLGILSKLVPSLVVSPVHTIVRLNKCTIHIFPDHNEDTDRLLRGEYDFDKDETLHIALIHASVGRESIPGRQLGYQTLKIPKLDICLFGDIHEGFPIYKSPAGSILANPGALLRKTKSEVHRVPAMALIDEAGKVTYKDIKCSDITSSFKLKKINQEHSESNKAFLASLARASSGFTNSFNTEKKIETIGSKSKYSKESINLLLEEVRKYESKP